MGDSDVHFLPEKDTQVWAKNTHMDTKLPVHWGHLGVVFPPVEFE